MNTTFAITISPPYRTHNYKEKSPQYNLYIDDSFIINQIFKKCRIARWIIFPEFSEKGRIHYHGTVTCNMHEEVTFYKQLMGLLKQVGLFDFKKLNSFNDKLRWLCYIRKDWHKTQQILDLSCPLFAPCLKEAGRSVRKRKRQGENGVILNTYPPPEGEGREGGKTFIDFGWSNGEG